MSVITMMNRLVQPDRSAARAKVSDIIIVRVIPVAMFDWNGSSLRLNVSNGVPGATTPVGYGLIVGVEQNLL